jgi:ubiquinone biosynthesis protein
VIHPRQILRLFHINRVLVRHGLDELIFAAHLLRPLRFFYYLAPWNWARRTDQPRGVRIRLALEELGPIFVKFGQILSTRPDLLPDDIARELAKLQDQVPPFSGVLARQIVEKAYGRSVADAFKSFDEQPLASASIAQVHAAQLKDGREVIVKVVRPGIARTIRRDIELLYTLAGLAERYWPEARRLRPREVVAEYEKTIFDELDLQREGASASQLRRNFAGSRLLYVPEVHWDLTRENVMVMERIYGIPISDVARLKHEGVDLKKLSENGVEIFFTQVFRDSFFHADMHPGNIFVALDGRYMAVDFGIMGALSAEDQRYLAGNFLAFFQRDYRRVAELHVESGWVPEHTRIEEFEAAIRTVCEPIFQKPLSEISFGHVLVRLFQTARRFNMEIQPQLVLLQKTLLNIEGLGRQLYPELDLWQTAKPYLERWMSEQFGARGWVKNLRRNAMQWSTVVPELPALIHQMLKERQATGRGSDTHGDLRRLQLEIRRANRRTFRAITGSTFVLGAVLLLGLQAEALVSYGPAPIVTWMLGALGALILIFAWPGKD